MLWIIAYVFVGCVLVAYVAYIIYLLQRRGLDGLVALPESDKQAIIGSFLNVLLLVIALVSLHIAVAAFQDAKQSGAKQERALNSARDAVVSAGTREQTALEAARQAIISTGKDQKQTLDKARQSLQAMVNIANQQRGILAQELANSKRQLEAVTKEEALVSQQLDLQQRELQTISRKPSIEVRTNSWGVVTRLVRLFPFGVTGINWYAKKNQPVQVEFWLRNTGDAPLIKPVIRVQTDAGIHLRCVEYPQLRLGDPSTWKECDTSELTVPDLFPEDMVMPKGANQPMQSPNDPLSTDFVVYVTLDVPAATKRVSVRMTISGDNSPALPFAAQYGLTWLR